MVRNVFFRFLFRGFSEFDGGRSGGRFLVFREVMVGVFVTLDLLIFSNLGE